MDYARFSALLVEKNDYVAVVTLNRPEKLNATGGEIHQQLEEIWTDLAMDEDVRVVVLTGAGRAFSAGGDIKAMKVRAEQGMDARTARNLMLGGQRIIHNMLGFPKPVIAAVNGPAIGLGATVALTCDIVIAKEGAVFGDTHVKVGVAAGDGGCVIWPLLIGFSKAKELLFTGDLVEAREAEKIGLISKAVPADEFWPAVMRLAQRLAKGSPMAISYTKMAMNKVLKERANQILDTSLALEFLNMFSKDHLAAINAFLEKREPAFLGL